jgi:hypothetical protein
MRALMARGIGSGRGLDRQGGRGRPASVISDGARRKALLSPLAVRQRPLPQFFMDVSFRRAARGKCCSARS